MRSNKGVGALVLALALVAGGLRADTAAATAAFKRGQQYQAAKQWGGAVKEYKAALAADPNYFYAYKNLGTTYYQAGDKRGALAYYDRYLKANPSDAQTKAFAEKLRAELGGAAAPAAATGASAASRAGKQPFSGLSLGLGAGGVMAGADDLNKLLGTGAAKTFSGTLALAFDLGVDYGMDNGFIIGAKLGMGPNRSHPLDFGAGGKVTVDISNLELMLSPGYCFPMNKDSWIDARIDVGMLMTTMTVTSAFSGTSVSTKYTGSGFGFVPQVAYAMKFTPNFAGRIGLGYMISSVSPLTDEKGNKYTYTSAGSTTKTDLALSTGGLAFRLGVEYHL